MHVVQWKAIVETSTPGYWPVSAINMNDRLESPLRHYCRPAHTVQLRCRTQQR